MLKIMRAWDFGHNKVRFVYRDPETGRSKLGEERVEWYFFISNKDFEENRNIFDALKEQKKVIKYQVDSHYTRVFIDREHASELLDKNCEYVWEYKDHNLFEVKKILQEHNIQTYEADLLLHKRWIIDNDVPFESEFKVLGLDLETDDEKMTGQLDPAMCKILSCAVIDFDTGKEAWMCADSRKDEDEKKLIEKIAKVINGYDVIVSWNGNQFDFQVLKCRMMMYGIQIDWRKKFLQDHMEIYKKLGPQLPSYSLDYVGKAVTEKGKIEHDEKIFQMYLNNKPLLREYNLEDVRIMFNVEKKTKFLSVAREVNTIGKCPCDDFFISRKIDNLILRRAYEKGNFHFKTKVKEDPGLQSNDEDSFEGAFVFDPVSGIHTNVVVADFSALYPSVIRSFNLSNDTIIESDSDVSADQIITTPNGYKFRKDFVGLIPEIIMDISNKRNKYRKMMKECENKNSIEYKTYDRLAYVYKFFGLSFYGVMGLRTSRFYDVRIAESTTLGGQFFTKTVATFLESKNRKIVCGDTDSIFFICDDKKDIDGLLEEINSLCQDKAINQFNCSESHLSMAYDKAFSKLLVLKAKKRYAGYLTYLDGKDIPSQLYVKGLECVRTDACMLLKKKQKELITILLDGKKTEVEMRNYVNDLRNFVLYDLKDIESIKIAQKLTKEVDEYKTQTMHLKVVEELRSQGIQVYIGDKIDYYISHLDKYGKPVPKAARFFDGKFDRLYFWSNKLYPALERVLESVFPNTDWTRYRDFGSAKKMANTKQGRMNLW